MRRTWNFFKAEEMSAAEVGRIADAELAMSIDQRSVQTIRVHPKDGVTSLEVTFTERAGDVILGHTNTGELAIFSLGPTDQPDQYYPTIIVTPT